MQTIEILDIKPFMQLLFQKNEFDSFSFVSASLKTDMNYEIDGHINKDFFSEEERAPLGPEDSPYMCWQYAKDRIFQLIKGKKTPTIMKLVLRADNPLTSQICQATSSTLSLADVDGMFLNILFQNGELTIVCGISYKIFTMDKQLEQELSSFLIQQLKLNEITCQ